MAHSQSYCNPLPLPSYLLLGRAALGNISSLKDYSVGRFSAEYFKTFPRIFLTVLTPGLLSATCAQDWNPVSGIFQSDGFGTCAIRSAWLRNVDRSFSKKFSLMTDCKVVCTFHFLACPGKVQVGSGLYAGVVPPPVLRILIPN